MLSLYQPFSFSCQPLSPFFVKSIGGFHIQPMPQGSHPLGEPRGPYWKPHTRATGCPNALLRNTADYGNKSQYNKSQCNKDNLGSVPRKFNNPELGKCSSFHSTSSKRYMMSSESRYVLQGFTDLERETHGLRTSELTVQHVPKSLQNDGKSQGCPALCAVPGCQGGSPSPSKPRVSSLHPSASGHEGRQEPWMCSVHS